VSGPVGRCPPHSLIWLSRKAPVLPLEHGKKRPFVDI